MNEKYLSRTTRDYVRGFMSRAFNVNQPKSPDIIRFTNIQKTEGVNSDGNHVKISGIKGQPTDTGMGYLVNANDLTYYVVGPNPEMVNIDGSSESYFVMLQKKTGSFYTAFRTVKLQKGSSSTLYDVPITLADTGSDHAVFEPVPVGFSSSGKNIFLFTCNGNGQAINGVFTNNPAAGILPTWNTSWQKIMGFSASGTTVSGTITQGQPVSNWTVFPTPATPDTLGGGAGWTPVAAPTITDGYGITSGFTTTRNVIPQVRMDSNGVIDVVGIFTATRRLQQTFTDGTNLTVLNLLNTNSGRFQILDLAGSPQFSYIIDKTIVNNVTSWNAGGATTSTVTSGTGLGSPVIYRNSNGAKAAVFRDTGITTRYYWIQNSYLGALPAPLTVPVTFTNNVYITDGSPFDSTTLIKPTDTSGQYLTVVPTDHLTRYTLNNDNVTYSSKQFSIAAINTTTYGIPDWILTQ